MSYTYVSVVRMDRQGLRDASTVKITCWLYQTTQVQFLHPHGGLQQSAIPLPEVPTPSSDFMGTRHTHDTQTYMQAEHSYLLNFNFKIYIIIIIIICSSVDRRELPILRVFYSEISYTPKHYKLLPMFLVVL